MRVKHVKAKEFLDFGKLIKDVRTSQKISQEALAFDLGVTRRTIWAWEVGITSPTIDFASDIIERLGGRIIFEMPSEEDYPLGRNDWQE